jgi:ribulose-phosphate 3-epimerase
MTRPAVTGRLMSDSPLIAPSMLKCDFGNLHREVELLEAAGARVLHWDVMDGHFVPNLTYGQVLIKSCRKLTTLPFDAHLMISDPARYVDPFIDAGCDLITFHIEAVPEPRPLLQRIRSAGVAAGLALNPETPVEAVFPAVEDCDLVLVMSVEPGFGGQKFLPVALDKLRRLRQVASPETLLSVDGGIDATTIVRAASAGANLFVAGSSVFDTPDYRSALEELSLAARGAAAIPGPE